MLLDPISLSSFDHMWSLKTLHFYHIVISTENSNKKLKLLFRDRKNMKAPKEPNFINGALETKTWVNIYNILCQRILNFPHIFPGKKKVFLLFISYGFSLHYWDLIWEYGVLWKLTISPFSDKIFKVILWVLSCIVAKSIRKPFFNKNWGCFCIFYIEGFWILWENSIINLKSW